MTAATKTHLHLFEGREANKKTFIKQSLPNELFLLRVNMRRGLPVSKIAIIWTDVALREKVLKHKIVSKGTLRATHLIHYRVSDDRSRSKGC